MFRPKAAAQLTTPLELYTAEYTNVKGVRKKVYAAEPNGVIMANWKTYGGTEKNVNGIIVVEDTAEVVTWYRPDITSGCKVKLLTAANDVFYEIINEPENIEQRNQFVKFKCRRITGGA